MRQVSVDVGVVSVPNRKKFFEHLAKRDVDAIYRSVKKRSEELKRRANRNK